MINTQKTINLDNKETWINILGCEKNQTLNKVCPLVLCNYEKQEQQNNDIFNRNFPNKKLEIRPDFRSSFKECGLKYKDMNMLKANNTFHEEIFTPGKGDPLQYFNNVDIESNLFRIPIAATRCMSHEYKPTIPNENIYTQSPTVLNDPHIELNKIYDYNDNISHIPKNCPTKHQKFEGIKFNNISTKNASRFTRFESTNDLNCMRHPVTYQFREQIKNTDNIRNSGLQVGPTRLNHSVEKLWNNSTKMVILPNENERPKGHNQVFCNVMECKKQPVKH